MFSRDFAGQLFVTCGLRALKRNLLRWKGLSIISEVDAGDVVQVTNEMHCIAGAVMIGIQLDGSCLWKRHVPHLHDFCHQFPRLYFILHLSFPRSP